MPGFIGKKLCPELIIVAPNYDKYRQVSAQVQEVLAIYDPQFCSMGLDEAYLDLTTFIRNKLSPESSLALVDEGRDAICGGDSSNAVDGKELLPTAYWQCAEVTVEELRHAIFTKTGLTASAGIAPNKMLAKVASDVNKPDGQYLVSPTRESVLDFIQKLPIRKVGQSSRHVQQL
jgi:DNA polymerase kappa